ncbi:RNA polymerase sigma factor [Burkholderia sp. S-53]|uniref:RNA polymerase sigma factor n=1 Tax=Burkholderia sp. S-53 TaxID=2906514 RepID=UPI0021D2F1EB|nr:RNA polymerase sigma factor [Burkholderia sp. S-53]UXU85377.1 RNA polymerase sigma factor [Burkholderia sp. S-53]
MAQLDATHGKWDTCTETQLIIGLARRETGAFDEMLRRYQLYLLNQCKRLCNGNRSASEDLYGVIILRLLTEDSENLIKIKHLGGWLRQVALYQHIDERRKMAAEAARIRKYFFQIDFESMTAPSPEELYLHSEILFHLKQAIDALPPNLKAIAIFRYVEELPSRDIAACTGLSDDAVRKRLQLAKTLIKKSLESILVEDSVAFNPATHARIELDQAESHLAMRE